MKQTIKYKIVISAFILIISALHYWISPSSSPLHNFYRLLYFIPIILAALNFGFKGGVVTSLIVSLIYSPFMLLSIGNFGGKAVNELLDIILFFALGIITGTLVEKKNYSLSKLNSELKRYVLLENYTNSIIESIRSGVVAVNNDMLITMINQGAKDILNLGSECTGQNFTEIFSGLDSVKEKIIESIEKDKINENIEITQIKEGKELTIKVSIFPLTLEGLKKGIVIIFDDITDIKKLQYQIQRNYKLSALGELSAGIAHEIRNPLGIIKAIEQTMKKELKSNLEAMKELEVIDEEVERANRVVKSLMEFGKPRKDEKMLYSINIILEEVLIITNKYALQNAVNIEFEKSEVLECLLDKEQLKQAFINIIFNAVQAMPEGGKLKISTQNKGKDFIKIVFEDTGVGIEANNLEKIFNPFYTTKSEGTGMGLSIVHKIMEEYEGWINVSSSVGEGTIFEILLPYRKDDFINEENIDC